MLKLSQSDRKLIHGTHGFQSQIARECGVTRQTVYGIIVGRGTSDKIERAILRRIDELRAEAATKVA